MNLNTLCLNLIMTFSQVINLNKNFDISTVIFFAVILILNFSTDFSQRNHVVFILNIEETIKYFHFNDLKTFQIIFVISWRVYVEYI